MKSMLAICLASAIASLGSVAPAAAQNDGLNDTGLHGNRDYFSQFPFEHIDAATGALVLTFTDLVLPGPKGRDLRFQRTYNSKDHRWTFGIAGYALYMYEPGFPPVGASPQGWSPVLYMADGSEHATRSMQSVDMTSETSIRYSYSYTTTDRFWRVHRGDIDVSVAYVGMPDGTECWYEGDGPNRRRLKRCLSPLGVEEFSIDWEASTITQTFLGHQRTVNLVLTRERDDGVLRRS